MSVTTHRVWVYGDHINTDVIFPGKYTYTLKTQEEIASKALEDLDSTFITEVSEGDIIVGGVNWGSGSSREQAVTALRYCGVTTIIAASFNGLYFRNCINQGVRPIVCLDISQHLKSGDTIIIDHDNHTITIPTGELFTIPQLSSSVLAIINSGGLVPMLSRRFLQSEAS